MWTDWQTDLSVDDYSLDIKILPTKPEEQESEWVYISSQQCELGG
jgi:hypothetical protein